MWCLNVTYFMYILLCCQTVYHHHHHHQIIVCVSIWTTTTTTTNNNVVFFFLFACLLSLSLSLRAFSLSFVVKMKWFGEKKERCVYVPLDDDFELMNEFFNSFLPFSRFYFHFINDLRWNLEHVKTLIKFNVYHTNTDTHTQRER